MKIYPNQLAPYLQKSLLPFYLIAGSEPLQVKETMDSVRQAVQKQGFVEREVFEIQAKFDWTVLEQSLNTSSLFSPLKYIELNFTEAAPSKDGIAILKKLADEFKTVDPTVICCLTFPKCDTKLQNTAWFKALEQQGLLIHIRAQTRESLLPWLKGRLQAAGFSAPPAVLEKFIYYTENNLLACQQLIEKLQLFLPKGPLTLENIAEFLSHQAHFSLFDLADACLNGDRNRAMHILNTLKAEGTEPILILWALTKEIRNLVCIATHMQTGLNLACALEKANVWQSRLPLYKTALNNLSLDELYALLGKAQKLDTLIKSCPGQIWENLLGLILIFSGLKAPIFAPIFREEDLV